MQGSPFEGVGQSLSNRDRSHLCSVCCNENVYFAVRWQQSPHGSTCKVIIWLVKLRGKLGVQDTLPC